MSTGALVASMILVWRILLPFYSLCTMIPRLEQLRNSILQVNTLMDLDTEADTAMTAAALPVIRGDISFDQVTLKYNEDSETLIHGLTLNVPAGCLCAVTGRNGSGKSSLLKMLKALYRPATGTIRIDGFDMRQMEVTELRRQISYVPQRPDFFPGTLAENLVIGNPFATAKEIESALTLAGLDDSIRAYLSQAINNVPMTETVATALSLARAYLQNTKILLIDELPNSLMNGPAGKNLKAYIKSSGKTVLIATHRGDLLQMADIVIRLSRHTPPQTGTYEHIMTIKEVA